MVLSQVGAQFVWWRGVGNCQVGRECSIAIEGRYVAHFPSTMTGLCVSILQLISSDLSAFVDCTDIPEDTLDSFTVFPKFV